MKFRKDINGLRAIAVIAVVLFHFNPSLLPGGFAGVDVFFVISGYLMTGIIFKGIEQKNFSILTFYAARINRIIPALLFLVFVLLIFGWFYLNVDEYKTLGKHVLASITFISNVTYWQEAGYFDMSSHTKWLLHTWSLSVEWQFYIMYPLIIMLLRRMLTLSQLKTTLLLTTFGALILSIWGSYKYPDASYFLLPTRSWEMMCGAIAYLYPLNLKNERIKKFIELIAILIIIGVYLFTPENVVWPGYMALLPVIAAYMLIQAHNNTSLITGNMLFQKIGTYSYSIYLWHWPLAVLAYDQNGGASHVSQYICLSILLGIISYYFIESTNSSRIIRNLTVTSLFKLKPVLFSFLAIAASTAILVSEGVDSKLRAVTQTNAALYLKKFQPHNYLPNLFDAYCSGQLILATVLESLCLNSDSFGAKPALWLCGLTLL